MSDPTLVLDASAVLAVLNDEAGGPRVASLLPNARISAVNLSEVVAKLAEHGMPESAIRRALDGLGLEVVDLDRAVAYRAGMLLPSTKASGLSLGDRACLALALHSDATVVTADRRWAEVVLGVTVQVIR